MKIKSVALFSKSFDPVEVEISFMKGLPGLGIFGDVDSKVRQAASKLKSAIIAQGYRWPHQRQMVIWVRSTGPSVGHESELAMALAILLKSQQLPQSLLNDDRPWVGALGLDGQVILPTGATDCLFAHKQKQWISPFVGSELRICNLGQLRNWPINSLAEGQKDIKNQEDSRDREDINNPSPQFYTQPILNADWKLSARVARVAEVAAAGEHHLLMAGPSGSGKTTLARTIHALLPAPNPRIWEQCLDIWSSQGEAICSRPFVDPHHSATALSVVGGGQPPQLGEMTRAHGGILFLDEYLQFDVRIQEALREPLERGLIRLARGTHVETFPAEFMLIAATNLCPCGKWTPMVGSVCGWAAQRCQKIVSRLSGPMLDRFVLVAFSHEWQNLRTVSILDVQSRVSRASAFRRAREQRLSNQRVDIRDLEARVSNLAKRLLPNWETSERKRQAVIRVANTLADLEEKLEVGVREVSEAIDLVLAPLTALSKIA